MGARYFTADLHLGHARMAELRGFNSVADHDWEVLAPLFRLTRRDTLYVLGDICSGSSSGWRAAVCSLGCVPARKRLVLGNHDCAHPMHRRHVADSEVLHGVFEWWGTDALVRIAPGLRCRMSHFPYRRDLGEVRYPEWRPADAGGWLLHGHTHSQERVRVRDREFHVGWDAWRRPVADHEVEAMIMSADA